MLVIRMSGRLVGDASSSPWIRLEVRKTLASIPSEYCGPETTIKGNVQTSKVLDTYRIVWLNYCWPNQNYCRCSSPLGSINRYPCRQIQLIC